MNNEKYNGWTNYPTWKVNLEVVDGYMWDEKENAFEDITSLSDYIKDFVETCVLDGVGGIDSGKLAYDYASVFLSYVNYYEIAQHVAEDYPKLITGVNTNDGEPLEE